MLVLAARVSESTLMVVQYVLRWSVLRMAYTQRLFFFGVIVIVVVGSHCSFHFLTSLPLPLFLTDLHSHWIRIASSFLINSPLSSFRSFIHPSSSLITLVRSVPSFSRLFASLAH